jgi:uncharacterized membrane protein
MGVTSARIRYPRLAYMAVGFLAICLTPMVRNAWLSAVYLIPLAAAAYVVRTGTDADLDGLTVRTLLGAERLSWSSVEALRVGDHGELFAVQGEQELRLPAARLGDLPRLTALSEAAAA